MVGFTKTRLVISVVVAIASIGGGAYAFGFIQKPDFGIQDKGDWVTEDGVEVDSMLWLNNTNPVSLNLTNQVDLHYRLKMNGVNLAKGDREKIAMEKGYQELTVRSDLVLENIPAWWSSHLNNGEVSKLAIPLTVDVSLGPVSPSFTTVAYTDTINTSIESIMDSSAASMKGTYSGSFPTSPEVTIVDGSAEWGKVTEAETNLIITTKVKNTNSYPISIPGVAGELEMNEVGVAEWDADSSKVMSDSTTIAPGETDSVKFRVKIDNQKMTEWLQTHIENNEKTGATLTIQMLFDIQGVKIRVPGGDGMKCDFNFKTAILEDNQTSGSNFEGCEKPGVDWSSFRDSGGLLEDGSTSDDSSNDADDSSDQDSDNGFNGLLG